MANLIYGTNTSLDGYIEDQSGSFDWGEPDDEVHSFINDLYRPVGTFLHGRRLYETMAVWETDKDLASQSPIYADFAKIWQGWEKVVYSTTLKSPSTSRTQIKSSFDPDEVRELKSSDSADLAIGGADLAASAFREGLVDEVHVFVLPVVVGGGKPAFQGMRLDLELVDHHRFERGTVFYRYRVRA